MCNIAAFVLFLAVSVVGFSQTTPNGISVLDVQYLVQPKSVVNIESTDFSGRFSNVTGRVSWSLDSNQVNGFDLIMDVNSLELEIPGMTKHAKSSDFFDAAQYPSITFFGDSLVNVNGNQTVFGIMKAKGTTKLMGIPFTMSHVKSSSMTINAEFTLKRSDFLIGPPEEVSDDVKIKAVLFAKKITD